MEITIDDKTNKFIFVDDDREKIAHLIYEDDKVRKFRVEDGQEIEINKSRIKSIDEIEDSEKEFYWERSGCIYKITNLTDIEGTGEESHQIFDMICKWSKAEQE